MNRYWLSCLLVALALPGTNAAYAQSKRLCTGEKATLQCLKENFTAVYEGQYYQFQIILASVEKEALSCNSVEKTAAYLDIASKIGNNLEVEDYFKDMLETKFLKDSPICLLDALLQVDNSSREIILGKYLQNPIFIKKTEVDTRLSKYKEHEKYKEMLRLYYGK